MKKILLMSMLGCIVLSNTYAAPQSGNYLESGDWVLACDNTKTCRMAGYQNDASHYPVSILFTRYLGRDTASIAQIKILDQDLSGGLSQAFSDRKVTLYIQNKNYGTIAQDSISQTGRLTLSQTNAMIKAVKLKQKIKFKMAQKQWELSSRGGDQVLQKMNEIQHEESYSSSAMLQNKQPQNRVESNLREQIPEIVMYGFIRKPTQHFPMESSQSQQLLGQLKKVISAQDCPLLLQTHFPENTRISIYPITQNQVLVESPCKYQNQSEWVYWVMDAQFTSIQQLVTLSGSSYSEGHIFERHSPQSRNDCESIKEWAWNGQKFVVSYLATTGLCKGFPKGAWQLPTYVSITRSVS
ncbi:DUF1176 domain-containing protein [Acinetobacter guerrae]|uniref:DUF1176 domain-containing protein n=1 Tax=Acinetobacter guerrae TaxID=1843371 RepID=A0A3A8ED77_9GAMM|nr:DUF1176 domain-containing protein [Acinetobacter guerrae]RKG32169.1 DUF1176 domain-containing protein [Acinetobacter guerrae]